MFDFNQRKIKNASHKITPKAQTKLDSRNEQKYKPGSKPKQKWKTRSRGNEKILRELKEFQVLQSRKNSPQTQMMELRFQ